MLKIIIQNYKKVLNEIRFIYNKFNNIVKISRIPYFSRLLSFKKYQTPLKRSKSGFENEFMLIDSSGRISNASNQIISKINKKYPKINISKEVGKQMIELHSFPSVKVQNTALNLIRNAIAVAEVAEKLGIMIYPFASYPGKFEVNMQDKFRYKIQSKVLGEEIFKAAHGSFCGFHFHYSMPRGVFDYKKIFLKKLARSKIKHSFIDCYNMLIALDPALITFMQSSPFVNNMYFAKDSRVIRIRGGKKLDYMEGLFAEQQLLGGLPPYKHTIYDLKLSLRRKDNKWRELIRKSNLNKTTIQKILDNKITLDYIWNPVKINKIGTFEQRGMDTNYLSYSIASAVLIKYVLRAIQQDFLVALPSDTGIKEPFKMEGNVVYIPPHSFVRNKLQKYAAYEGIHNKSIYIYCKKFLRFAKALSHDRYTRAIKPIEKIIEENQTISDFLVNRARKEGYELGDDLNDEFICDLSLDCAKNFIEDLYKTEKIVSKLD